jgi:hypothetical protein
VTREACPEPNEREVGTARAHEHVLRAEDRVETGDDRVPEPALTPG